VFRLGGGVFRRRGVTIQIAGGQVVLVVVLENGWGEDELAANLGQVLDLNRQTSGLERQLVGILAETLADAPDGSVRIVARVLAHIIVDKGVSVKTDPGQVPQEALYEALCWYLGVDGNYGWQEVLPSSDSLRPRTER
jgi:hypothetical protein